ncbi:MAG: hypothetical protein L3K13_06875 [Thermoplasmata archaeon]|nr:hypothetical protein [Thermoplasmata archaeon]
MSWSSGIPTVAPSERPPESAEAEPGRPRGRPSAWVPPSGHLAAGPDATRVDVLLYLLAGTGFLLLFLILTVLTAFDELGRVAGSLGNLLELREAVLGLGFVGLVTVGFAFWFFPTFSGIPIRPRAALRAHLVLETVSLLGYVVLGLAQGASDPLPTVLLVAAALSYLLVVVPILLAIFLALGNWRAGLL